MLFPCIWSTRGVAWTVTMLCWVVFSLSILVTSGHVIDSRLKRGTTQSSKTVIVIEFAHATFESVYLKGGVPRMTTCTAPANNEDPCSLPIRQHIVSTSGPDDDEYQRREAGDHFLDPHGREDGQEAEAIGTPTRKLNSADEALTLANSLYKEAQRLQSEFWLVELDLDCSKSDGKFEVQVLTVGDPQGQPTTRMRQMRDREYSPKRFPGLISRFNLTTAVRTDERTRFVIPGLEGWFQDTVKQSAPPRELKTSRVIVGKPVTVQTSKLTRRAAPRSQLPRTRQRMSSYKCLGTAEADVENTGTRNHIGLCGHANVFRYNAPYCEINTLT